jgi:ABC-type antimicrobial peptide transport system permease subunit
MIRNYFKIAWRNLVRNRFSSIINICGLATGIAVILLNGLWVWDELSFNKYHQHYNKIAKVTRLGMNDDGKPDANGWLPLPLADELKTNYSQYFEHILLATELKENILVAGETKLPAKGRFVEAGAPAMLSLKMIRGSITGLQDLHSVILSASTAKAMFGNQDPIDKTIQINRDMQAKVTGVYENLPRNTEFNEVAFLAPFDLWASVSSWVKKQGWDNQFLNIYVQLKPGLSFSAVSSFIKDAELNKIRNMENRKDEVARNRHIWLLPMSDWHLYSNLASNGPAQLVWMIGLIGAFVLLLACINFMNLSTARSQKRAREVGVRKVIGSGKSQLIHQFLSESVLIVSIAFIAAIALVIVSLPWFNEIAAKKMALPFANPYFWLIGVGFILITGFIAGIYPAFYLSSFQPIKVLKGTFRSGRFSGLPRKALVVVQFTVSVALIIGAGVIFRQIQHAKDRPVGYNRDGLLLIEKKTGDFYGKYEVLKKELQNTGVVATMAESRSSTTDITMWNGGFSYKENEIKAENGSGTLAVTSEYGKTVGWQFIAGRDFSSQLTTDSAGFVINESFARLIGIRDPVGETLTWETEWRPAKNYVILGVVKDMIAMSPYKPPVPTVFFMTDKSCTWINIRLNPSARITEALSKIGAVFKKIIPDAPFDYKFADEQYALKFAAEERIGKLAGFFAILAIFISCLGLFGLASYMAEQRTKEIGIRKIIGASVFNLWGLLSKDFVVLVILSCMIAIPLAYYFLSGWLQQYQYRTELSWWIFALTVLGALMVTLLTVSFQAIRTAMANPVKSLRTE